MSGLDGQCPPGFEHLTLVAGHLKLVPATTYFQDLNGLCQPVNPQGHIVIDGGVMTFREGAEVPGESLTIVGGQIVVGG